MTISAQVTKIEDDSVYKTMIQSTIDTDSFD